MKASDTMKKISLVIPCYNEEENIALFYKEFKKVFKTIDKYDYELLFIDDGSLDNTYSAIKKLNIKDKNVKCISFSKNFGKEASLFAGLKYASGDAIITIDCDLQHPIDIIPKMIDLWNNGYEIVKGVKKNRKNEKSFNVLTSKIFNKIMSVSSKIDMQDASDFNLVDKKVAKVLCESEQYNSFYRALTYWIGFNDTKIYYDVNIRKNSKSKWSFFKRLKYSIKNLIQFTNVPINFIGYLGIIIFILGLILVIDTVISYFKGNTPSGYATLILFMILSTGAIIFCLGIIGIYIVQIYEEIKKRPKYLIKDKF